MKEHTKAVLAEFDDQFGVGIDEESMAGRLAGCDGCFENMKVRREHRDYLKSALSSRDAEWRKRIEGLRKNHEKKDVNANHEKDELWCCLDCKDDDVYNSALSDLLAVEEEATN